MSVNLTVVGKYRNGKSRSVGIHHSMNTPIEHEEYGQFARRFSDEIELNFGKFKEIRLSVLISSTKSGVFPYTYTEIYNTAVDDSFVDLMSELGVSVYNINSFLQLHGGIHF